MRIIQLLRHPIHSLDDWWAAAALVHRLDHNPANFCMIVGLLLSSLSIILQGPTPSSTLSMMSPELQIAMCTCIFSGLGIKLHGVFSHTRFWFPKKSLRKCYQNGYTGAPLATSGMLVYGYYIVSNTPTWLSALGSVLVGFLGIGVGAQGILYWLEARRIERNEATLIKVYQQAVTDNERHTDS